MIPPEHPTRTLLTSHHSMTDRRLAIMKFGGSILRDRFSLDSVVEECRHAIEDGSRVIAVISAYRGLTDSLERSWLEAGNEDRPDRATALARGEFTTAGDVSGALLSTGIRSTVADLLAIGLRAEGDGDDADPIGLDPVGVESEFRAHDVLVVPGFLAIGTDGRLVLLGRGGSDLTAIHLACHLNPERCELIKDVDGLYSADPSDGDGDEHRFRRIGFDDALALGDRVVQPKALLLARKHRLEFNVRAIGGSIGTTVGPGPTDPEPRSRTTRTS